MRAGTRKEISRLLKSEKGTIIKSYGDVRVALVYPNSYRLGMSNLGFQAVYSLINANPISRCERSFLLDEGEAVALESGSTLSGFDVVAFSVSFELDYSNIPEILRRAKIPPRTDERGENYPLVMAGGAAVMLNPEPIAEFVDVFVIGEAETVLDGILSALAEGKGKSKILIKESLAQLEGVYVPGFYHVEVDDRGRRREVKAIGDVPYPVRRNPPPDIELFGTATAVLTPETTFGQRLLVEVSRGCPRKCKFCAARFIYWPPRRRTASAVMNSIKEKPGEEKKVGLLGADVGEHPEIEQMCCSLVKEGVEVSVSSVRADKITPGLARTLAKGGARTLTIAPECGSERMRKELGKGVSNAELVECARTVRDAGIKSLKVYFMVGLPGEERDDLEQIVARVAELSSIIPVKVSISPFVPKARTPYERIGMRSSGYLRSTLAYLRKELSRLKGVGFSAASPKESLTEGALARGDRPMSAWLERGFPPLRELEELACRTIPDDEMLPWDMFEDAAGR